METIVIVVHVIIALAMAGLILMQQGKGADAGASFGSGASQTVFGSQGGASFFAKLTALLAVLFFVTSFSLTVIAKNKTNIEAVVDGVPVVEQIEEAVESDVPTVEDTSSVSTSEDIPTVEETVAEAPAEEVPVVETEETPEPATTETESQ